MCIIACLALVVGNTHLAASAQAQLAVAQSALCAAEATSQAAAGPADAGQALDKATQLQRTLHVWVDTWDTAGRAEGPRQAVAACQADKVSSLYIDALVHMAQADFDAAQTSLAQAERTAPKAWCAGLRLRQGVCALHRQKPQEALMHLHIAQQYDSRRIAIRLATAQVYLALGQPAACVASLRPLLQDATQAPSVHEIEQARALVGMAIEDDAGHISPLERTAMRNLLAMAQSEEADAQSVEMALSLAEAVPRPRVQTAAALVALKGQRVLAGRKLLEDAAMHAPLDPDPARLLALYNVEHGGPNAALPCLSLAAERDPFNTETQTLIAELSERTGDFAQAEQTQLALMRLQPLQTRHQAALARVRVLRAEAASNGPHIQKHALER